MRKPYVPLKLITQSTNHTRPNYTSINIYYNTGVVSGPYMKLLKLRAGIALTFKFSMLLKFYATKW